MSAPPPTAKANDKEPIVQRHAGVFISEEVARRCKCQLMECVCAANRVVDGACLLAAIVGQLSGTRLIC